MKRCPRNEDGTPDVGREIRLDYRNYRGLRTYRVISPVGVWFGFTEWHPQPQWLLHAYDWGKEDFRDFALSDCNFMGAN